MRFLFTAVLIISLVTHLPRCATSAANPQTEIAAEEYSVYNAVIAKMFAGNKVTFDFGGEAVVSRLIIRDQTVSSPLDDRSVFQSLEREAVDDYLAKNKQPSVLKPTFNLTMKYVLMKAAELKQLGVGTVEHPITAVDGTVGLSRVGFNAGHTQALVYMTYICGGLCGHGFFLFLTKTRDEWKVEKEYLAWIS